VSSRPAAIPFVAGSTGVEMSSSNRCHQEKFVNA